MRSIWYRIQNITLQSGLIFQARQILQTVVMSNSIDMDTRLARLREKSRLLSNSMKDHEDRLTRMSNSLAKSQRSAISTKEKRESDAFRSSLVTSLDHRSIPIHMSDSNWQQGGDITANVATRKYSVNPPLTTAALATPHFGFSGLQQGKPSPEKAVMDAAKDYVNAMTTRNTEIEELRRVITVKTVKLRLAEEEVERLKHAEATARTSNLELSGIIEKLKDKADIHEAAKEDLASRILALENTLDLQKKANERLQTEITNEVINRENAIKARTEAVNEARRLKSLMDQASSQEENARTDLRTERMEFIESQKLLRKETITLTQEITTLASNNSELRSKVAALERATNGTMSENKQLKMVHKATVQQLLATREELRDEQNRRRKCESDLARYRGVLKIQMRNKLQSEGETSGGT